MPFERIQKWFCLIPLPVLELSATALNGYRWVWKATENSSDRTCDLETGQVWHLQVGLRWQHDLGLQQDTGDKALRRGGSSVLTRYDLSCWRWKMFREDERVAQKCKVCLMYAGTPFRCLPVSWPGCWYKLHHHTVWPEPAHMWTPANGHLQVVVFIMQLSMEWQKSWDHSCYTWAGLSQEREQWKGVRVRATWRAGEGEMKITWRSGQKRRGAVTDMNF